MSKKGYSRPGFFGSINHYDANGKKKARADQESIEEYTKTMQMERKSDIVRLPFLVV